MSKGPRTDSSTKKRANNKLYQKLLIDKLDYLNNKEKGLIEPLLKRFAHVFHEEDTNDFKSTTVVEQNYCHGPNTYKAPTV
jgi:hypothetical protein